MGSPQLLDCAGYSLSLVQQAADAFHPSSTRARYTYSLGTTLSEGVWHHFRIFEMGIDLSIAIDGVEVFRTVDA